MILTFETGYAVSKDVEVVINSANGLLFADSAGAGAIREASGKLSLSDQTQFRKLFAKMPKVTQDFFERKRLSHKWDYKHVNLSCLGQFAENNFVTFPIGSCVVDELWSTVKGEKRLVVHAITLTYDPLTGKRFVGTVSQIESALFSAIEAGLHLHKTSFALPVACARPAYGLGPEQAFALVCRVLSQFEDRAIRVVMCFDNAQTSEYFENKLRGKNPLDFL
jgi:hypothetical protein